MHIETQYETNGSIETKNFGKYEVDTLHLDYDDTKANVVFVSNYFGGFPCEHVDDDLAKEALDVSNSIASWDEVHIRVRDDLWLSIYK